MAFCKIQIVGFGSPGRSRVPARIFPADCFGRCAQPNISATYASV